MLAAPGARAEVPPPPQAPQCIELHARGQDLRREGRLLQAEQALQACSRDLECPGVISTECAQMLEQLRPSIPTLVFAAIDAQGRDTADVQVYVESEQRLDKLPIQAVEFNPGRYQFRFVGPSGEVVEKTLLLREGEKNRRVVIDFRPVDPPPVPGPGPESSGSGVPVASYVLGGLGILGLGSFTYFGLQGKLLEDDCSPRCSNDQIDDLRRNYLIADISLGVGIAALGAATIVFLASERDAPEIHAPRAARRSPKLEWQLGAGPGSLQLSGSF